MCEAASRPLQHDRCRQRPRVIQPVVLVLLSSQVGDTCLHVAARYNHQGVLKILLHSVCAVTDTNQVLHLTLHCSEEVTEATVLEYTA